MEGAHHTLKSYIKVSTGNLYDVHQRIGLAVTNQVKDIEAKKMNDRIRHAHNHRIPLLSNVLGRISAYALNKTLEQRNRLLENTLPECTDSFTTTMGKGKQRGVYKEK